MIKRIFIVIVVFATCSIIAQRNNSSPYSFFGIGENFKTVTAEQASMGGIGAGLSEFKYLNFTNPAANSGLRVATYAIGGEAEFLTLSSAEGSESGNTTSLRYIALGFPIGKKAGFSAGLQPVSSVGYALFNEAVNEYGQAVVSRFKGSGGTSRIYGGFGIDVYKGLSLGLEVSYAFGNIENSILKQVEGVSLITKYSEDLIVRGGGLKLGAQYKTKLKNNLELNTGVALNLQNRYKVSGRELLYSLSYDQGVETPRDLLVDKAVSNKFDSPLKTTLGATIGKQNKWLVGMDYEFQDAIQQESVIDIESYAFENATRLSLGGYYIPKINSISSYWNRITYRAGLRIEKTGLLVDNSETGNNFTSINDFGINIGFGLPLPRQVSSLNIGVEYGQKGTTDNNLIKEDYFNVRLSLSLNSINWFKKREID